MKYYLRKEPYEQTIPEIKKTDGEVIPERKYIVEDRALYFPTDLPRRRYRSTYPEPNQKGFELLTYKTMQSILEERQNLFDYCGEWFDVYDENNQKVDIGEAPHD